MPIGTLLRDEREQAGLSAAQISERTRIPLYKIEALENCDFVHLPDGIYLDGIVRAYARELALEPEPLIERLHRERPPIAQDSAAVLKSIYASKQNKGRGRAPWKAMTIDFPKTPVRKQRLSGSRSHGLTLLLLSVFAALCWGLYFYDAIRAPGAHALTTERRAPADAIPQVDSVVSAATMSSSAESGETAASVADVSGSWTLVTFPERSRTAGLNGARHDYELYLEQDGDRVTGSGRRMSENGRAIESRAQTSISVAGTIHGEHLTLAFTELGARRAAEGKFVLVLEGHAAMRGRFSRTAAPPSGLVEARRPQ